METDQNKVDGAHYDVIVIGGGAAGLSGALALARSRRSVLVVDGGQPRNAPASHMHNYLSRDGLPPGELLAIGRGEVEGYGGLCIAQQVRDIRSLGGEQPGFAVELGDGAVAYARRLLVATGLVDELPDIPGVAERWGRDVLHCPYCHGWEVRDQAIGVLATGPHAAHQALLFRQLSDDVTLFTHTAPPLPDEQREQLEAIGVTIIHGEVAALEIAGDRLEGVRMRLGEVIARQAVVVAPRFSARAGLLRTLGLEPTPMEMGGHTLGSFIATDGTGATAVRGVWAAGNVADPMAQVITSAAAGLRAGAAINADLAAEDAAQAVAERRRAVHRA